MLCACAGLIKRALILSARAQVSNVCAFSWWWRKNGKRESEGRATSIEVTSGTEGDHEAYVGSGGGHKGATVCRRQRKGAWAF